MPRLREREGTATPAELAEDARRIREAREQTSPLRQPDEEGSLTLALRCFAGWGHCPSCRRRMLFLANTALCGPCQRLCEALTEKARPKVRRHFAATGNLHAMVLS